MTHALPQICLVLLNFTLAAFVIYITLPFAFLALVSVYIAIYCRWKTGIYIFIFGCTCILLYGAFMLFWIISRGQASSHPLDITWYSLQVLAEFFCIIVALWVLWEISSESSKKKDKGESQSLLGK
ncbi:hypothetical protein GUITHDRAFT_154675 [Guillardia theta CCMP2712]|uniref:Uncharacterized protein n=1 Tax=Guillardia theta (strain CCMP2712) TaxID=905079 RepID=L1IQD1_GUITC|nr:hypothetical protein GUITHDRAFT_154675 [Guillardia theta CCMP2712]EKX38501.1 hypothetical protein GUITHDRAFT_154675 [Guillardia theta CCMP2712]|mmetsp:Transcript_47886/g.150203  ORF Transcript_47886/g.150203 Transcript_47886/m.150203 type:complete len:126 (+) Transcript_47886:203-580(+)|eukprot:XP_005825481.1 hypothetical protein GUITHDRAFT_154675 [Guillardia theta CCMP2712]